VDDGAGPVSIPSKEVGVEYITLDDTNRTHLNRLLSYLRQITTT
jgi:hypothetical protein